MKSTFPALLIFGMTFIAFNEARAQPVAEVAGAKSKQALDDQEWYALPPFALSQPDFKLSPHTGMTRAEWFACGRHILTGAFQYVDKLETPMFLPKFPGKSYPRGGNDKAGRSTRSAAIFEAIARTFNVAAPLIADDPDIEINGIRLVDYYRYHFLQLLANPDCDYFIGLAAKQGGPRQQTCELGNLAMWNILLPDVFWNRLNKEEQDRVARTFSEWSVSWTWPHNWRWFNVMMMTFLDLNGYEIDKTRMFAHLDNLLLHYAGDGWFRDTSYDYYTIHVFQLYGAVWCREYGRQHAPGRAKVIDQQFEEFMPRYPMIFGRNGTVNMYGRSILYRLGASSGMPAAFLRGKESAMTPGLARRVASGALLQFVTHPKFFNQGIPSLGFYGPFEPGIQGYSCSASPYWMLLNFSALTLPADDPFWTAREELGHWKGLGKGQRTEFWPGPGMLVSNHGPSGASELRPGKVHNTNPNYCRLAYSTAFPWEANVADGPTSASLCLKNHGWDKTTKLPQYVDVAGYREGVFYRQATFKAPNLPGFVDMATIVVPGGEIRVERVRKVKQCSLFLGHYSLPHMGGEPVVAKREIDGKASITASVPGRQLALTTFMGWDDLGVTTHEGIHPESENSSLIFAKMEDAEYQYGPVEMLVSVLLHKTDNTAWTDDQLQPISDIAPIKEGIPMELGGLLVRLKNGEQIKIDFKNIDGASSRH